MKLGIEGNENEAYNQGSRALLQLIGVKFALADLRHAKGFTSRVKLNDKTVELLEEMKPTTLVDDFVAPRVVGDFTESASRIPGAQWKNFDQLRSYLGRQKYFHPDGVGLIKSGDSILNAMGTGKNAAFTIRNGKPFVVLRSGATNREVLHEIGHMLTHKHLGNDAYYALSKPVREHLASTFVRSRRSFARMSPDEIWQEMKAIDPNFVANDTIRELLRRWGALIE